MKLFFSLILTNNNLPLKIYCESIVIIDTDFNLNVLLQLFFFSQIFANNNLPLKIYCENIVIKIDTDFNLNVLLKLYFSLSKKIIFFLTNIN